MAVPRELGPGGRRLWRDVAEPFELAGHEQRLLLEACRTVDDLDRLAAVIAEQGVLSADGSRAHPALVEARNLRTVLGRLLGQLRIPDDVTGDRDQHRTGFRGAQSTAANGKWQSVRRLSS